MNYSTVEKEALALITAVRAFSVYFGLSTGDHIHGPSTLRVHPEDEIQQFETPKME